MSTLELNSKDINDLLLLYVLEYLRNKKYRFSVIKLVKNAITDEGGRLLLSHLAEDDSTQILNLTSNQLTARILDLIIFFCGRNSSLRTFYLTHNKIPSMQVKNRRQDFEKHSLEIVI